MVDGSNRTNIVHCDYSKFHKMSRSVGATGVHALFLTLDHAYMIRKALKGLLAGILPIKAFLDSRTFFNVIAKNSGMVEQRSVDFK